MSARSKLNRVFGKNLVVLLVLFLLVAFCATQVSFAGIYSYRDDKGKAHFVDSPSRISKKYREKEKGVRKLPDARKAAPQTSSALGTTPYSDNAEMPFNTAGGVDWMLRHEKARSLEKATDFYKDLKKKLLFRASTSGLPNRFRPSS